MFIHCVSKIVREIEKEHADKSRLQLKFLGLGRRVLQKPSNLTVYIKKNFNVFLTSSYKLIYLKIYWTEIRKLIARWYVEIIFSINILDQHGTNSLHFRTFLIWNNLPSNIKSSRSACEFKNNIKNLRGNCS